MPEWVPFEHRVAFLQQPTADTPARVRVSIRNTGERQYTVSTTHSPLPLPEGFATTDGVTLVVTDAAVTGNGCLTQVQTPTVAPGEDSAALAPRDQLSAENAVIVTGADNCWPAGTFTVTQSYVLDESGGREYDWSFTLRSN